MTADRFINHKLICIGSVSGGGRATTAKYNLETSDRQTASGATAAPPIARYDDAPAREPI